MYHLLNFYCHRQVIDVHQSCLQFTLLTVTQVTMMLQKCIIDRDTDSQANNPQTKKKIVTVTSKSIYRYTV